MLIKTIELFHHKDLPRYNSQDQEFFQNLKYSSFCGKENPKSFNYISHLNKEHFTAPQAYVQSNANGINIHDYASFTKSFRNNQDGMVYKFVSILEREIAKINEILTIFAEKDPYFDPKPICTPLIEKVFLEKIPLSFKELAYIVSQHQYDGRFIELQIYSYATNSLLPIPTIQDYNTHPSKNFFPFETEHILTHIRHFYKFDKDDEHTFDPYDPSLITIDYDQDGRHIYMRQD